MDTGLLIILVLVASSATTLLYLLLAIQHSHCPVLFANNSVCLH